MKQSDIATDVKKASDLRDIFVNEKLDAEEMMSRWTVFTQHLARARAAVESTKPRGDYSLLVRRALLGHIDRIESDAADAMTKRLRS